MPTQDEAFAALRAAGLLHDDRDLVKLFDLSAPDYVERARTAKPALFAFDARRAAPEEIEARLAQIDNDIQRRGFQRSVDALIGGLREAASSTAHAPAATTDIFDARTAPAADVEARLAQLTGGR